MNISKEETEETKKKFIEKYCYLYQNAIFLSTLFYPSYGSTYERESSELLENLLLSDDHLLENSSYYKVEIMKKNLRMIKKAAKTEAKYIRESKKYSHIYKVLGPLTNDSETFKLLCKVYKFIQDQTDDVVNKDKKLLIIDEYIRLARCKNDGKIWISGYHLLVEDTLNNLENYSDILTMKPMPSRKIGDVGVSGNNNFIDNMTYASPLLKEGGIHLTEKEKQKVYLSLHDELACDLTVKCKQLSISYDIERPEHSKPCGETFILREENIYILDPPLQNDYCFYYLCPHCGYIVNIRKDLIQPKIQQRIIDRCHENANLYHINYLKSELKALELLKNKHSSENEPIKTLK